MKDFKLWFFLENYKDLIKVYRDRMKDTPENKHHHPEGNSWEHVKLVYRAILSKAKQELNNLKNNHPIVSNILSDIDFSITIEEQNILNLVAFLHDIAKPDTVSADGQRFLFPPGEVSGKIQAIGHDDPKWFAPAIEKYRSIAPKEIQLIYDRNKDLIDFLIYRHMDHIRTYFPNDFLSAYFDNGKLKNHQKVKLLLILMWADMLGRERAPDTQQGIDLLVNSSIKSKKIEPKKAFAGSVDDFRNMLKSRGLSDSEIEKAIKSKFG